MRRHGRGRARALAPALAAALPEARWLDLAAARAEPGDVQAAVVANPPPGSLQGLPQLRLIQSLWAGVDRLLADATLPAGVPIARMVDPAMSAAMAETALWAVLSLQRDFFVYARQQRQGVWRQHAQRRADDLRVLVLGQGADGPRRGRRGWPPLGYRVTGWRRDGSAAGAGLLAAGRHRDQPAAADARHPRPARCPLLRRAARGAAVVNLARGAHVVDADLLAALDSGHLRHAVLDVFHAEPLPAGHPFWSHPRVTVLPHAAAATDPRSAAAVAAANLRAAARRPAASRTSSTASARY